MGVDFTNVNIHTTDIFIFAGIVLAAIGAIWGIRKMIYLGNVSDDFHDDSGSSSSKIYGFWDTEEDFRQDLSDSYSNKYSDNNYDKYF